MDTAKQLRIYDTFRKSLNQEDAIALMEYLEEVKKGSLKSQEVAIKIDVELAVKEFKYSVLKWMFITYISFIIVVVWFFALYS